MFRHVAVVIQSQPSGCVEESRRRLNITKKTEPVKLCFFIWSGKRGSNPRLRHKLHFSFALLLAKAHLSFVCSFSQKWQAFSGPRSQAELAFFLQQKNRAGQTLLFHLERETGIEPATSALARLRYTTKPFPHNFLCCPQMFCFYNITNLKSKIKHFNTIFKKNEIFVAVDIFQVETYKILW